MTATKLNKVSLEDYIRIEQESNTKYEYHDGTIYAMAGGSDNHTELLGNIFFELRSALKQKGKPCRAFNSEMKLHIEEFNKYLYPDAMVVCGEVQKPNENTSGITNPLVIVEVLSDSTEAYDRGDKFFFYKHIPIFKV